MTVLQPPSSYHEREGWSFFDVRCTGREEFEQRFERMRRGKYLDTLAISRWQPVQWNRIYQINNGRQKHFIIQIFVTSFVISLAVYLPCYTSMPLGLIGPKSSVSRLLLCFDLGNPSR